MSTEPVDIPITQEENDQVVDPWTAICPPGGFQYDRLIEKFGVTEIDDELKRRFEKVTDKSVHSWISRNIVFAHREFNKILDDYEAGKQIYLYTGRGPTSDALHMGHMVPFLFTKWLHDVFDKSILVIQIADDEKFYFKDLEFETVYNLGFENVKDIIACGFDAKRTFIFSNRDFTSTDAAKLVNHNLMKRIKISQLQAVFGLDNAACLGQYVWTVYQSAAAFSEFFGPLFSGKARCLVTYAIDQDPYFRICRDVAQPLGFFKPCSLIMKFLPALEGDAKMSSTKTGEKVNHTIFMTDDPDTIYDVIKKHAFSGGRETLKEHRELGADLEKDISFQYLRYFEHDDEVLKDIATKYGSGEMLTSQIKKILADTLIPFITEHQKRRANVTRDDIVQYYSMSKFTNDESYYVPRIPE